MDPMSVSLAVQEGVKASVIEGVKEVAEKDVKESIAEESLSTIENSSLESLKLNNDLALKEIKAKQLEINRIEGAERETKALNELNREFPKSEGYKIHSEVYLRDQEGKILKADTSGEARRVDFMVEKDQEIVKSIEVTSETAPKEIQLNKGSEIRENGGNYIKGRETGNLIRIPQNIDTEIRRYA